MELRTLIEQMINEALSKKDLVEGKTQDRTVKVALWLWQKEMQPLLDRAAKRKRHGGYEVIKGKYEKVVKIFDCTDKLWQELDFMIRMDPSSPTKKGKRSTLPDPAGAGEEHAKSGNKKMSKAEFDEASNGPNKKISNPWMGKTGYEIYTRYYDENK
tara:strand:+ start:263 stop:733 length:471 start_codon:yes stop_codon:yes gene_type:complete